MKLWQFGEEFPFYKVGIVCFIRLAESIAFAQTFPYQFHILKKLRLSQNEADIFKYNGYLFAIFHGCQAISLIFWSKKSDTWGRKPVIIIGLVASAISLLIYGFSGSYKYIVLSKVIGGLFNANVAITRTLLGEVTPIKKHQLISFATFPLMWNLGSVIGPYMGAKLKTPSPWQVAKQAAAAAAKASALKGNHNTTSTGLFGRMDLDDSWDPLVSREVLPLFKKYPFAPPNIAACIILLVTSAFAFLFLEESQKDRKKERDRGFELGKRILSSFKVSSSDREADEFLYPIIADHRESSISSFENEERIELDLLNEPNIHSRNAITEDNDQDIHWEVSSSSFFLNVVQAVVSQFIFLFHVLVYSEFVTIFLGASVKLSDLEFPFHVKGGFGFDESKIASIMSWNGVFGVFATLFILPFISGKLSVLKLYRFALALFPICYFLLPLIAFTISKTNLSEPSYLCTALLYLNLFTKEVASVLAFSHIILLIHQSSSPKDLASINGYSLSISSLTNTFSPLLWGTLMTAFDNIGLSTLFWWILASVAALGFAQSFLIMEC